jgi:lipopolysaccharide/colanic/teichoic acid biosynthesis glycosyltransferase
MNEESYSNQGPTTLVVGPGDIPKQASINGTAPATVPATLKDIPLGSEKVPLPLRLFEVFVAATVLLLTLPIMLVMAWLIRRGSPGKALFFQTRVGLNQRPFKFVKFRTLYDDAKQRFPHLYAYKYGPRELEALKFKVTDDPRVTPQGKWMRNTTLDELPNFWNVLTGEMALVGPRPEIPEMLTYYQGEMLQKFTVRPGITGLAQVSGRGRLTFHDTVKLDVAYVKNRSLALDLKILVITIYKIIVRDGAF